MADAEKEEPVMLPFADKEGTGWHVVVRYHEGHERRIDGFATEQEAVDWIMANAKRSISRLWVSLNKAAPIRACDLGLAT
jgi:hypothetical protein